MCIMRYIYIFQFQKYSLKVLNYLPCYCHTVNSARKVFSESFYLSNKEKPNTTNKLMDKSTLRKSCSNCFLLFLVLVFVSKLRGLRTSKVTFESVRVDWEPVPEPFILGYRVLVKNNSFSKLVAWNKSFITIDGFHSNSSYVIKIYPVHGLLDEHTIDPASVQSITVMTEIDRGQSISKLKLY